MTVKQCPYGTVLYSDDTCKPTQQEQPAKIDHYMDFSDVDAYLEWKNKPKKKVVKKKEIIEIKFASSTDCMRDKLVHNN